MLVHGSTHQGNPLLNSCFFEPRPGSTFFTGVARGSRLQASLLVLLGVLEPVDLLAQAAQILRELPLQLLRGFDASRGPMAQGPNRFAPSEHPINLLK